MRPSRTPLRSRSAGRGGTLLGVFIGLVLGLAIAAAVAYFLGRSGLTTPLAAPGGAKEPLRSGKPDLGAAGQATEKPRFAKTAGDRRTLDKGSERGLPDAAKSAESARPGDRFWLQAGAFASAADAEDMKARLALSGWEAAVQMVAMPDRTQRYRVRLGPYDNADELNRIKSELGGRGFDVAVIKNQ